MQPTSGRALAAGTAALALAVVAGCGGGTSVASFCEAGEDFSTASEFDQGVKAAQRLDETGTPDDMPRAAREGFEVVVGVVTEAQDQDDLQERYAELTAEDKDSVEALDEYIKDTC